MRVMWMWGVARILSKKKREHAKSRQKWPSQPSCCEADLTTVSPVCKIVDDFRIVGTFQRGEWYWIPLPDFLFYLRCQRTEKENPNCYLSILIWVEHPPLTFQIGVTLHLLALLKYCWKGSATLLLLIKVLGLRKCHLLPIDWLAGYHFNS